MDHLYTVIEAVRGVRELGFMSDRAGLIAAVIGLDCLIWILGTLVNVIVVKQIKFDVIYQASH